MQGVITQKSDTISANKVILATGHSARDIFELLDRKNILIEAKPFALGVRVEHPQPLIDNIQYRQNPRDEHLLPLFTALGAAGADAQPEAFYRGIYDHVIAMDGYAFH